MSAAPPPKLTRIVDLRPSLQPVTVQFIVLDKADPTFIRKPDPSAGGAPVDTPTAVARVADASGSVALTLHGRDEVTAAAPGDVFRLTGGLFTLDRGGGGATLRAGRRGALTRLGHGDLVFSEAPDMSSVRFAADAATGLYAPVDALPTKVWAPPAVGGGK